ncbi:E3 ubiquitin-protein ligase RHF2A isoform X1 [Cryptomeria japonica]|uniref:E3 ubiquitin-protein ligase RHF2A isoform X1 n=2 Tax=Cryptomeria japonica TaxID=3369 RepID=UPI0027D9E3A7|nr:E3 ubiquitin-protein ligase RHF2A isoform X1 [Cryptomeria japonica]
MIQFGMEETKVTDTHLTSAAAFVEGGVQDACDDACSICLEAFTDNDPATVTSCKHEYHLQCILEWSQRSKECPMCWRILSLKDPASQELLAAVEQERNIRLSRSPNSPMFARNSLDEIEFHHVPAYTDDSDFEERLMQHLAAAAMGRGHFSRRESLRHRSSGQGHPQFLVFSTHTPPPASPSNAEAQNGTVSATTAVDSATPVTPVMRDGQLEHGPLPSTPVQMSSRTNRNTNVAARIVDNRSETFPQRNVPGQHSPENQQRARPSEFQSFSESLKSRFSAVSSRYKESISRGTRGFREKLFARNNAVAELGREVQREVSAGIAGVTRIMERLDPSGKNNEVTAPVSDSMEGSSAGIPVGHGTEEHQGSASSECSSGSSSCGTSSGISTNGPQIVSDKSDSCIDEASVKQDIEDSSGGEASVQHTATATATATVISPVS